MKKGFGQYSRRLDRMRQPSSDHPGADLWQMVLASLDLSFFGLGRKFLTLANAARRWSGSLKGGKKAALTSMRSSGDRQATIRGW